MLAGIFLDVIIDQASMSNVLDVGNWQWIVCLIVYGVCSAHNGYDFVYKVDMSPKEKQQVCKL